MRYRPTISEEDLAGLRHRIAATRWPERETVDDDTQGLPLDVCRNLVDHWLGAYDWDRFRDGLTTPPQVRIRIDGLDIHAIHALSPHRDATPLVLTHGWPSSPFEFTGVIGGLTDPPPGEPAFHVICPSLPGHGFSGRPSSTGWGRTRTADAWATLASELGHDRFLAHGGDWGALVTTTLALRHPERLIGIHLTLPEAAREESDAASADERDGLAREAQYRASGYDYARIQRTRPQTIGYSLVDSPVGLLAWLAEKYLAWSDRDDAGDSLVPIDHLLDTAGLYWLTATGAAAARMYAEALHPAPLDPVTVPSAFSVFPAEIIRPPRSAVARRHTDLRFWHPMPLGGHFPAVEVAGTLVDELRRFAVAVR